MKSFIYVLLPLLAVAAKADCGKGQANVTAMRESDLVVSKPKDPKEIERDNMVEVPVKGVNNRIPFGYSNNKWLELLKQRRAGDSIVLFETAPERLRPLYGVAGYALLRRGCVVATVLRSIS